MSVSALSVHIVCNCIVSIQCVYIVRTIVCIVSIDNVCLPCQYIVSVSALSVRIVSIACIDSVCVCLVSTYCL